MNIISKASIEKSARLSARHGDREDCHYPAGSEAHKVWMAAYEDECRAFSAEVDESYEDAQEREYARVYANSSTRL